ncbi:unnamed protein product [Brassica rapa]|uniref:Uncharacterized protein n=2 Tax=Brassica campestris TaxID=3711 RepID=A0A8D9HWI4_BRACM|nr:unnamed protein product [Brassica rapa]
MNKPLNQFVFIKDRSYNSKIAGQLTRICFHREHISLLRRDRLWFLQSASSIGGRISETAGEKRHRGINTQKSNATVQDLMRISIAASSAINGGMKKLLGGGGGKTSLGGCGGLTGSLAPAVPVKFSNDTERLQFINGIRKVHVGAYIKTCH